MTQPDETNLYPNPPDKPEQARRGVVTNPLVVSSVSANRKGDKERPSRKEQREQQNTPQKTGQKTPQRTPQKDAKKDNGSRKDGAKKEGPKKDGGKKRKSPQKEQVSDATKPNTQSIPTAGMEQLSLNKILYPDMFDDAGERKPGPPIPNVSKGDAYSGSSFHSAPEASSLPRPSFASPKAVSASPGFANNMSRLPLNMQPGAPGGAPGGSAQVATWPSHPIPHSAPQLQNGPQGYSMQTPYMQPMQPYGYPAYHPGHRAFAPYGYSMPPQHPFGAPPYMYPQQQWVQGGVQERPQM